MPIKPEFDIKESPVWEKGLEGLPNGALLIPEEVAFIFHCTVGRLADDRNTGNGIPFVKHGGDVFYKKETLVKFIAEHEYQNTAQAKAHAHVEKEARAKQQKTGRGVRMLANTFSDFISSKLTDESVWPFTFTGQDAVPEDFFSTIGRARAEDRRELLTKASYLDEVQRATDQRATREAKEADIDPITAPLLAKAPKKPKGGI